MRTVTIMESVENNFNLIFVYEDKKLSGMNYKMMNKKITEDDFKNKEELLQIYLAKACVSDFDQYKIGCEAVMEYFDRENINQAIYDMKEEMIHIMLKDERVGIEANMLELNQREVDMVRNLEITIMSVMKEIYQAREYRTGILKHAKY